MFFFIRSLSFPRTACYTEADMMYTQRSRLPLIDGSPYKSTTNAQLCSPYLSVSESDEAIDSCS